MSVDEAIVDYSAGIFLRYFRGGERVEGNAPRLDHQRDMQILMGHWAISAPVRSLVRYVLSHPHEAQSLLTFRERVDDAIARGRINAIRTWQYRLQSGLPSAVAAQEPVRSYNTGPNLVLAWVLREASAYTSRLSAWQGQSSPYKHMIADAEKDIRAIQRLETLRDLIRSTSFGRRPSPNAFRAAARARQPIYRFAIEAYKLLQGIERGDEDALNAIARSALIAPLELWRRFELAVGLAAGEAIAKATDKPLVLQLLAGTSSTPIMTAGNFAIYWQSRTPYYVDPDLEPSEVITRKMLKAYNLALGSDRPDLVVVDQATSQVVSIIEVKYLAGDTANARFREAIDQVVRYARGYAEPNKTQLLISKSLVALSHGAPELIDMDAGAPASIDFLGITQTQLASWAAQLVGPQP